MKKLKLKKDLTGFPMVWVDAIGAYMHWLPITKIQFECFLCAAPDSHFDATWYDEVLNLNPRVAARGIQVTNYWNAFLTGIMPSEAQSFARWCEEGYTIPTLQDWFAAYKTLKSMPPVSSVIGHMGNLGERQRTVLTRLDSVSLDVAYDPTLADQMLMRMGVMEWVVCDNPHYQWGGMGQTPPEFHGNFFTPDHGQPNRPNKPNGQRLHYYGFRLIWRPV